jgi:hypothetical protein
MEHTAIPDSTASSGIFSLNRKGTRRVQSQGQIRQRAATAPPESSTAPPLPTVAIPNGGALAPIKSVTTPVLDNGIDLPTPPEPEAILAQAIALQASPEPEGFKEFLSTTPATTGSTPSVNSTVRSPKPLGSRISLRQSIRKRSKSALRKRDESDTPPLPNALPDISRTTSLVMKRSASPEGSMERFAGDPVIYTVSFTKACPYRIRGLTLLVCRVDGKLRWFGRGCQLKVSLDHSNLSLNSML